MCHLDFEEEEEEELAALKQELWDKLWEQIPKKFGV